MTQNLQWRGAVILVVLIAGVFLIYPSIGPVPEVWSKYLPASPIRLGLDLQGGLHMVLEVQTEKAVETVVDQTMAEVSALMKEPDVKIRYTDVERVSPSSFKVILKDAAQEVLFDSMVLDKIPNFRKLSGEPVSEGYAITVGMDQKAIDETKRQSVRQAVDTIRNRVDDLGVAEPDVVLHGEDRIIVQLPGLREDTNRAIDIIKRTARLEFKLVDEKGDLNAALKGQIPPGDEILYQLDRNPRTGAVTRTPYLLKKQVLMTGDVLTDARPRTGQDARWVVAIEFNRRGAQLFDRITGDHVRERLAIILDNRVYSAPVINERIGGGRAEISGRFTPEEASDLALILRHGSLPAPVQILETRSVGPSLGADSIKLGRNAVVLGLVLVMIFMAIYYKWSGVVADIALILNLLLIFAVMVAPGLRATLTLPGLAGVALTMGMAVDANVVIFERIREELRAGKSPRAALEVGYARAFSVIFDSNLTTLLAALPLIQFGTGPIKGFAVTLCVGLLVSLFTALFVTRFIFDYVFENMRVRRMSI
ncbi:MAG: protein translocase subunit SecD [Deltaproteobacteria bacterium]|nr:protein translocase subunit SecD [Deltaproteobacteria bacterium]